MAVMVSFFCGSCKTQKSELVGSGQPRPTQCAECAAKEAAEVRHKFLAELQALPLPERIAKLEAWAYDFERRWGPALRDAEILNTRF